MKTIVWVVVGIAAFAAFVVYVLQVKPRRENLMALYHLSQDGGPFVDYDNLATLMDNIFYPADAGQYIRWEVKKDEFETKVKIIPGWDVEVGKDNGGLYHRNPYDTGTRIGVSTPEDNEAFLESLPN